MLALGIVAAAIILFVGTGGSALSQMVARFQGLGIGPDRLLINALLLNVALIIFGWRRYDELCLEVRQRRIAEARARTLAETDPMTGCLNRRSLAPATERLIADAAQRGQIAAFIMIDFDNFKQINDYHGHGVGDGILIECARRIRTLLPKGALAARLGGDEFACVMAFDPRDPVVVDRLASALIEGISRQIVLDGFTGEVTVSMGMTRSDRDNRSGDGPADTAALLHMADIAMYRAKQQGRNRYIWFADSMQSELRYRCEIEAHIRDGIGRNEFVPYYEPQVDMTTGQLVGFEMLARWHSPTYGLMEPASFIAVAEDIGVIAPLTEGLIARALNDARAWAPGLRLAVNLSPLQVRDPWFAQKLLKLLAAADFPAGRLDIEITETCIHQHVAIVQTLVQALKAHGIAIVLDDYGSGHASLAQLRQMPLDRIKIDRAFVTTLRDSADSRAVVETIAMVGKGLGLSVGAVGVDSAETLAVLANVGAMRVQGHYFGRPMAHDLTYALLAARGMLAASAPARETAAPETQTERTVAPLPDDLRRIA